MNRQRIFPRNGHPLRSPSGPHALIILGIDNLAALEDLVGDIGQDAAHVGLGRGLADEIEGLLVCLDVGNGLVPGGLTRAGGPRRIGRGLRGSRGRLG